MIGPSVDDEGLSVLADMLSGVLLDQQEDRDALWRTLSGDLGLAGATVSDRHGGMGGGTAENWVIMESLGRSPIWTPYFSSVALAGGVLRHLGGGVADRLLPMLARGDVQLALAYLEEGRRAAIMPAKVTAVRKGAGYRIDGRKVGVLGLGGAAQLIVSAIVDSGKPLFLLVDPSAAGVSVETYDMLDGERGGDLILAEAFVGDDAVIGDDTDAFEAALDEAMVSLCAAACGTMRVMLDQTVEYCNQRHQFGRPLSAFQVLQHRMADMHVAIEQSVSITQVAMAKLRALAPERVEAASGAKVLVSNACRIVSQSAVQLHGGIGTTQELPIGNYFRRALMAQHLFGDAQHHLHRYEKALTQKV